MKLLRDTISVKNFGANAQNFYLFHFWEAMSSGKTYAMLQ